MRELARLCQFCKSLGGTKHEHKSTKYTSQLKREYIYEVSHQMFHMFLQCERAIKANIHFAENRDWTKHEDSNIIKYLTSQERIHLWSEWNASHVSIERKDHHGYVNFAKNYDEQKHEQSNKKNLTSDRRIKFMLKTKLKEQFGFWFHAYSLSNTYFPL